MIERGISRAELSDLSDSSDNDSESRILLSTDESKTWETKIPSDDSQLLKSDLDDSLNPSLCYKKLVLRVYKRRWFILALFSLLSFMQVQSIFYFLLIFKLHVLLTFYSALFGILGDL